MNLNAYGLLIALAILLGALLCTREEKERGLPKDTGIDIILYAVPPAIVGARLYYVLFALEQFRQHPLSVLYIWQGGLAIYGGVVGGALGLLVLAKKRGLPYFRILDVAAPSVLLGQAIGRWGNFFNQEAHGREVLFPALQFFPVAVQIQSQWYYATFFYESLWNFAGFVLIYMRRKRLRVRDGEIILWYLLWYALGRMVIEMMRTDSLMLGNLRVSQGLSMILFLLAAIVLIKRQHIKKYYVAVFAAGIIIALTAAFTKDLLLLFVGAAVELIFVAYLYTTYRKNAYAPDAL